MLWVDWCGSWGALWWPACAAAGHQISPAEETCDRASGDVAELADLVTDGGSQYTGSSLRLVSPRFDSRSAAEECLRPLPPGSAGTVRFDPRCPEHTRVPLVLATSDVPSESGRYIRLLMDAGTWRCSCGAFRSLDGCHHVGRMAALGERKGAAEREAKGSGRSGGEGGDDSGEQVNAHARHNGAVAAEVLGAAGAATDSQRTRNGTVTLRRRRGRKDPLHSDDVPGQRAGGVERRRARHVDGVAAPPHKQRSLRNLAAPQALPAPGSGTVSSHCITPCGGARLPAGRLPEQRAQQHKDDQHQQSQRDDDPHRRDEAPRVVPGVCGSITGSTPARVAASPPASPAPCLRWGAGRRQSTTPFRGWCIPDDRLWPDR